MKVAKVEGQVVVKDGSGLAVEFYEREFELDDAVKDEGMARAVIRKVLIEEDLRKSVENYKRVRTMSLVSLVDRAGKKENGKLELLAMEAVQKGVVPENLNMYKSPEAKEKALEAALARPVKKVRKAEPEVDSGVVDEGYVD